MGEHLTGKIFYLTAKTITRTVAENTFALLANHHAALKSITLTAKDKICILEKANCHPQIANVPKVILTVLTMPYMILSLTNHRLLVIS